MGFDFKQFHKDAPLPAANGAAVADKPQVGEKTPAGMIAKVLSRRMALGEVAAAAQLPAELVTMGLDLLVGMGLAIDHGGGEFGPAGVVVQEQAAPPVKRGCHAHRAEPADDLIVDDPPAPAPGPADGAQALLLEQVQALMAQNAELVSAVRHLQGERATLQVQKDPDEPPLFPGEIERWHDEDGKLIVCIVDGKKSEGRRKPLPMIRICHPCLNAEGQWIAPFGTSGKGYAAILNKPLANAADAGWIRKQKDYFDQLHRLALTQVAD